MGNSLKSFKQQPHSVAYKPLISFSENNNPKVFSFKELKKATKNFKEYKIIEGDDCSSRKFYKGYIDEYVPSRTGTGITVSVLAVGSSFPLQDREISEEQMQSLGQIFHPNVVKLLGYCCVDDKIHFLVFEYFHKRSLDGHIYGKEEALPWEIRVKIAIGVARAVEFIHFIKNKPLLRKLRMYSILLDEQYNAKLFYLESNKEDASRLIGGLEYEPPEYVQCCDLDMKSDVFIFGVILLDLLTGSKDTILKERRKNIGTGPSLLRHAQKIREIIDPRLRNNYPVNAVKEMGILIQRCTKWDTKERPLMQQVLDTLNHIAKIKD